MLYVNAYKLYNNCFLLFCFRKSLRLEPISPLAPSSSSCSSKESFNVDVVTPALACLNLSPAKTVGSVRLPSSSAAKFIPGHRKCRSLGTKYDYVFLLFSFYNISPYLIIHWSFHILIFLFFLSSLKKIMSLYHLLCHPPPQTKLFNLTHHWICLKM